MQIKLNHFANQFDHSDLSPTAGVVLFIVKVTDRHAIKTVMSVDRVTD